MQPGLEATTTTADALQATFTVATEVRFSDLDVNGHVNHAAYLAYAEAARIHHLASLGLSPTRLVEFDRAVVVLRLEIDYRGELALSDSLVATSRYEFEDGRRSFLNDGQVIGNGNVVAQLRLVLGLMDLSERRLIDEPGAALEVLHQRTTGA